MRKDLAPYRWPEGLTAEGIEDLKKFQKDALKREIMVIAVHDGAQGLSRYLKNKWKLVGDDWQTGMRTDFGQELRDHVAKTLQVARNKIKRTKTQIASKRQ